MAILSLLLLKPIQPCSGFTEIIIKYRWTQNKPLYQRIKPRILIWPQSRDFTGKIHRKKAKNVVS